MGLFEHWPYVNFHEMNLDWIIKEIPKVFAAKDEAQASAEASAESAEASQLSADASQQSADASQQSADASQQSADSSQESAENAAESEASAKNYADHIGDPVAGLVTDWLDDHVTPTTPIVDDTLTISGAAADSKKVGDEITGLKSALDDLADTQTKSVFDRTVSGTGVLDVTGLNIPAGTYSLHIDSVESSDTSVTKSAIVFYATGGSILSIAVDRNIQIDLEITLSADVIRISFYAAGGWADSQGKTCSFNNFKIFSDTELGERIGTLENNVDAVEEDVAFIKNILENGDEIKCANSYDLVVGDTFQLFYKGIIDAVYPENCYVIPNCSKGSSYGRMFEITPNIAETLPLNLQLYDNKHHKMDEKNVSLVVRSKATSPQSVKNVLCVGDSLTVNGVWPAEMYRRLTGTGGNPVGDGLSNISFIGTMTKDGAGYEGYGGWRFSNYNAASVDGNAKVITCTHDKTDDDQHSIYKDANNCEWKIETVNSGSIKIIAVSTNYGNFPTTGTLTWVSGGINHSNIVYTASQNAPGNPFWDSTANKVDFSKYAINLGISSIDYVYVLLGWNNAATGEYEYKAQAQTFIDNVQASFPNAKIVLMGLEIPARDGLGVNYGASGIYSNFYGLMQYVHNLDAWYEDLVASNTNVYHINISGQFDTEHNMQTGTRYVNTRNSDTETYQTNGVHPAQSGYLQIADAAYRSIIGLL